MITCANCDRPVMPTKAFSVGWFVFWFLFAGIGAIGYLIYFMVKPARECPICRADIYVRAPGGSNERPTPSTAQMAMPPEMGERGLLIGVGAVIVVTIVILVVVGMFIF